GGGRCSRRHRLLHGTSNRSALSAMKLSIITATLNAAEFLSDCIESVRSQRGEGFVIEHVVADGGSRDDTVAIATAGGCHVIQGKDKGLFDALNKGTRASNGDVVGCLGADDMLMPGAEIGR